MANQDSQGAAGAESATGEATDYKALYEQAARDLETAQADVEKWKELSRKNEGRAKTNAGAAKDLEQASAQLADLTKRLEAIETENNALKATAARAALVKKVAADTGVPEDIVATLAPNDEKALAEAATAIANAFKAPGGAPYVPEAGKFSVGAADTKTAAQQFADLLGNALGN